MTNVAQVTKLSRDEIISMLVDRDGLKCALPECSEPIRLSAPPGRNETTIEHWYPQWWCREQGWTPAQIWDISNLKLSHKKCNARKGERVPNPDGTLPDRVERTFRYRRQKRAERPEVCTSCNAGRDLGPDEVCASCNSGPQPERWPRWAKVKSTECLHDGVFWCWACSIGIVPMRGATETIMVGGEGGEN